MFNKDRALQCSLATALTFMAGCSVVNPTPAIMGEHTLCTHYLMYEMCAHDADRDGVTDYFYFGDDEQVFLLRETFAPTARPLHPCAQVMSPSLQATANDTLDPDIQQDQAAASTVKQRLIAGYLALLPKITLCQAKRGRAPESADDFLAN